MEFRALGPIELWADGQPHDLGPARARGVLAILLLTPRTIVPSDVLIDRLWDSEPPPKARESLSVYIARLRGALRQAVGENVQLIGRARGYQLDVDPESVDLHQFRRLRRQADALAGSGDYEYAARLLREADGLWRGQALAGVRGGDVIAKANGRAISSEHTIRDEIKMTAGAPLPLEIMRDGKPVQVTLTPREKSPGQYQIGVFIDHYDLTALPFPAAAKQALVYPYEKSKVILVALYKMVTGQERAELSGPIGITREIARAANRSVWDYFGIIAMLSVYLGLFNLLPLPALDGGRALFLTLEGIIRRRINPRIEATVHTVGLVVLIGVMVIVSFKDIFGRG